MSNIPEDAMSDIERESEIIVVEYVRCRQERNVAKVNLMHLNSDCARGCTNIMKQRLGSPQRGTGNDSSAPGVGIMQGALLT